MGKRDHALITFMLLTGCRLAETAALNVGDIDFAARIAILRKTKGGDPDRVMLSPTLAEILVAHMGGSHPEAPLFATGGRRLSTRQVQRIVSRRVQEAGITKPITAHSLRHSFATRLYNATGDIRLVQQALQARPCLDHRDIRPGRSPAMAARDRGDRVSRCRIERNI
jgi:integrase/recombinase XerD